MTLTFELIQHKPFNFDLDYNSDKLFSSPFSFVLSTESARQMTFDNAALWFGAYHNCPLDDYLLSTIYFDSFYPSGRFIKNFHSGNWQIQFHLLEVSNPYKIEIDNFVLKPGKQLICSIIGNNTDIGKIEYTKLDENFEIELTQKELDEEVNFSAYNSIASKLEEINKCYKL